MFKHLKSKEYYKATKPIGMFGGKSFNYPSDHKLGLKVPEEGSHCANCKFLSKDHEHCTHKEWIKWNSNDSKLPFRDEEYCCDLWELGKEVKELDTEKE